MTKSLLIAAMTVVALLILADGTAAQRPSFGRPSRPTTSPYLNLLRGSGGGGFAFNYFQRVRPEMEFRRNAASLRRSVNSLRRQMQQQQQDQKLGAGLGQTGHTATFLNLGGYFPGFGRSSSRFGQRR